MRVFAALLAGVAPAADDTDVQRVAAATVSGFGAMARYVVFGPLVAVAFSASLLGAPLYLLSVYGAEGTKRAAVGGVAVVAFWALVLSVGASRTSRDRRAERVV